MTKKEVFLSYSFVKKRGDKMYENVTNKYVTVFEVTVKKELESNKFDSSIFNRRLNDLSDFYLSELANKKEVTDILIVERQDDFLVFLMVTNEVKKW